MIDDRATEVGSATPPKAPLSGARGFGIIMGAMVGVIAVLWLLAWLIS